MTKQRVMALGGLVLWGLAVAWAAGGRNLERDEWARLRQAALFTDGFESGDTTAWSQTFPSSTVPAVVGLTRTEAETAIAAAGFVLGSVSEVLRISVLTGRVVGQDPAGGVRAAAGSAIGLDVVGEPPDGTPVPEAWAGRWRIEVSYGEFVGPMVNAVDEMTDVICPGDPVGTALLEAAFPAPATWCTATVSYVSIDTYCEIQVDDDGCTIDIIWELAMDRVDNTVTGSGEWTATSSCVKALPSRFQPFDGEPFTLSGVRLATHHNQCQDQVSSFLQKFLRQPLGLTELAPL